LEVTKSQENEETNGTPDGEAIVSGIEADALTEEQQILKEAEKQAAEKRSYAEKKVESMLEDAQKEAAQQADKIKKKMASSVELELKRRSLNVRGEVMRDIMSRIENKFGSMMSDGNYKAILASWLTEAAIGLDAKSAYINASEMELAFVDEQLISQVSEEVREKTGKQISLQLTKAPPLKNQGVVLTAQDGRTAFNNQVKTRMLRKEREIRMAIYDALFTDKRKEPE
jgi:vacuolar-type H+-ATPase subunit E/Vma4